MYLLQLDDARFGRFKDQNKGHCGLNHTRIIIWNWISWCGCISISFGHYLCKSSQGIASLALRLEGLTSKGHNFFINQAMVVFLFALDSNMLTLQLLFICQEPIVDGKPSLKAKHLKLSRVWPNFQVALPKVITWAILIIWSPLFFSHAPIDTLYNFYSFFKKMFFLVWLLGLKVSLCSTLIFVQLQLTITWSIVIQIGWLFSPHQSWGHS